LAATLDYLMGEFNGGCTAAEGCREEPLLAVILQEGNARPLSRGAPSAARGVRLPVHPWKVSCFLYLPP
jgi:hypothetical protein